MYHLFHTIGGEKKTLQKSQTKTTEMKSKLATYIIALVECLLSSLERAFANPMHAQKTAIHATDFI